MDNELAERALRVDINSMLQSDYEEAHKSHDENFNVLRARVLTAIKNGQPQSRAIVEHRKAWRGALGLPPLCESKTDVEQFLLRLAETNGAIVSSGCASTLEIADAQSRGDFLVLDNGLGFILRTKDWRTRAENAIRRVD